MSELDEKVSLYRRQLQQCFEGGPGSDLDGGDHLALLASLLGQRFRERGALSDIEEAVSLERRTLALRPTGHPNRANSLSNLASYLTTRFECVGALSDLEEALVLGRSALELRPHGHLDRHDSLSDIAYVLATRFRLLGALSDLDEALVLGRRALELRPHGHPDRPTSLNNVAFDLSTRFDQLGALSDLHEALDLGRSALKHRPPGHPHRHYTLSNIAGRLHLRFKRLRQPFDLDEALALQREALELRPQGHPHRASSLSKISSYLITRFEHFKATLDLKEAIDLEKMALDLRLQGHLHRATSICNLARCFYIRFKYSAIPDTTDLEETFDMYSRLSDASGLAYLDDLQCTREWIQVAEEYKHSTTVLAYQTFWQLSARYLTTLPSLSCHLLLVKQLMSSMASNAFSACTRNRNLVIAVELLEQGRGIFWSQLMRLRSTLDEVMASGEEGKELANEFSLVSRLLRSESQHNQAFHLNFKLQDIVTKIRELPGLSHFLLPPVFSDLREAAAEGPVIIVSASQYSCDALVLFSNKDPIHIPLRITAADISHLVSQIRIITQRAKLMAVQRDLIRLLRRLWDDVVSSIVDVLHEFCPRGSRVWWCPAGDFSLLPFHAAGLYTKGNFNFSDHYISSYTPTLAALIRARQKKQADTSMEHRFLIVGQARAKGQCQLASVSTELTNISQCVGSIATVTCVQYQEANIAKVEEELYKTHLAHFACHGIPDRKRPFESGFGLGDGLLRVEHIMKYNLPSAQFAYLSACHTTVGDEDSPDESIHLAAAMQFAGFGSVIGTMWAVDDECTDEITSKFYTYMRDGSGRLDPSRAALALHLTMRNLFTSSRCKVPFDQRILYVHIGP